MSGESAWFTDRKEALAAVDDLLREGGDTRVVVLTGVSGSGKSTLLAHVAARTPQAWERILDVESLVADMAAVEAGGEDVAVRLLREIALTLASSAPRWRRRGLLRRAAGVGASRPWRVRVWQWAGFGGTIAASPITVHAPGTTQTERRLMWAGQLSAVAKRVRRRRCLILLDSCERLRYFDDVRAAQHRPGDPLGVGGWFTNVLDDVLTCAPRVRVVLAAGHRRPVTLTGSDPAHPTVGRHRCAVHELRPWTVGDTRRYLARRGFDDPESARVIARSAGGLPVEVAWLTDSLGRTTDDPTTSDDRQSTRMAVADLARLPREQWVRTHVLPRLAPAHRRLLPAAVVLRTFTPQALRTVAGALADRDARGWSESEWGQDWFERLCALSALVEVPGTGGTWRIHPVVRGWLLDAYTHEDTALPPADRLLPLLHRAAAEYHEALAASTFSPQATHHRFALGDNRHSYLWNDRLAHALTHNPPEAARVRLLVDLALDPEIHATVRTRLPKVAGAAHLARAHLHHLENEHQEAQEQAEHAEAAYRDAHADHPGRAAALGLAGQSAWLLDHFARATTHWRTTLHLTLPDAPGRGALERALAEAVLNTGDLPLADTLLSDALHDLVLRPPPAPAPSSDVDTTKGRAGDKHAPHERWNFVIAPPVHTAVPTIEPGDAVPGHRARAHLHRLLGGLALHRAQPTRALYHLRNAYDLATHDPHTLAHTHRWATEIALLRWDVDEGEHHLHEGTAAARRCPDKRCLTRLLVSRADHADRKAIRSDPQTLLLIDDAEHADPATPSTPPADTAPRTATPAPPAPTVDPSRDERVESAHQRDLARAHRESAIALATELRSPQALAHALTHDQPQQALDLYRTLGDRLGEADARHELTKVARLRGDLDEAQRLGTETLTVQRALGDRLGEARTLATLADIAKKRGDLDEAQRLGTEALAVQQALGDRLGEARTLGTLHEMARTRGDLDTARTRLRTAADLYDACEQTSRAELCRRMLRES
ncbi:tetratricopeptide repeat protein [Embleya sp. NPDC001921]